LQYWQVTTPPRIAWVEREAPQLGQMSASRSIQKL
jgi:hypothetical protein